MLLSTVKKQSKSPKDWSHSIWVVVKTQVKPLGEWVWCQVLLNEEKWECWTDLWGQIKIAVKPDEDNAPVFPGISRFTDLPFEIPESYTSRITMDVLEQWIFLDVVYAFFLITRGISTHFLIHSWKFHIFSLFYPRKFHVLNPNVSFSEIAHSLVSILCEYGKERGWYM